MVIIESSILRYSSAKDKRLKCISRERAIVIR